ncbi:NACHT domain-containing protein [Mucilaginibacter pedocola]|uniref:Uncharacterized protein n=1 Tax=Mucilaginibacter pedocola TaxID=1792845 RepID=A0A1S9P7N4_9SPHI|nr:NACHT domain-containing protein [Mucilaginibacter pedocola]OOQ56970.1 hypothetical protein BC343_15630 [Mucilaginibacter pedocola]
MAQNELSQVKDALIVASPLIKAVVDTFLVPKLEKLNKRLKIDFNKDWVPTDKHFSEYFHRTYKKISVANTLVFNNSQLLLKEIYIPLTIRDSNDDKKTQLTGFPNELLQKYERILITDTAGMGKSTLMKIIFMDVIDKRHGAPILIELRRLSKDKTILKEIHEQISAIDKEFNSQLLFELIKDGGFIFILDGFDEISLTDREIVTADIQSFISKANDNKFILTSRPEKALASFGDFEQFRIEPLNKNEAFELLRKYDKQGDISTSLIKKLQESTMSNMEEFMTNPLLVSLLFTAFQFKQAIPFKKYLFYRQVYDANFENHDLTKGDSYSHPKYSKLEIDDFHRVLRHIGFSTFKRQKIEFDKDELLGLIRESRGFCVGIEFRDSDFLNDLLITVPLFTQDGNYYRWAHKSLQEYFAAQFIYLDSKEHQTSIISQIYNHKEIEKYQNILDLYYDMDYKIFRNVILLNLLTEFRNFSLSYLRNLDLSIPNKEITYRKELCFLTQHYLAQLDNSINHEDDDRLDNMIDLFSINEQGNNRLEGIALPHMDGGDIFAFFADHPKILILYILAAKKNPLVKYINRRDVDPKKTLIKYKFKKMYQFVKLTGNINSSLNSTINFENVNNLLTYSSLREIIIDADNAMQTLDEIEDNIKTDLADNFSIS